MGEFVYINGININTKCIKEFYRVKNGDLVVEFSDGKCMTVEKKSANIVEAHILGDDHIVQIMQAPDGLTFGYKKDDGAVTRIKPLCLALTRGGTIRLMDIDVDGYIEFADDMSNFTSVEFDGWDCDGKRNET